MNSFLESDSDEEYDDPIILMDFEQARIKAINESADNASASVAISQDKEDLHQVSNNHHLQAAFSEVSLNICMLPRDCRPLSIKVVDCDKYPWYYKKYKSHIKINMNSKTESVSVNQSKNKLSKKFKQSIHKTNKRNIDFKESYAKNNFGQNTLKGKRMGVLKKQDLEIKLARAVKKKNVSKLDFKRNVGLVGLKIIPTFEVFDDSSTDEYDNSNVKSDFNSSNECQSTAKANDIKSYLLEIDMALNHVGTTIVPVLSNENETHSYVAKTNCSRVNKAIEPNLIINKDKLSKPFKKKIIRKGANTSKNSNNKSNLKCVNNNNIIESNNLIIAPDNKKGNVKDITKTNKYQNYLLKKNKQIQINNEASETTIEKDSHENKASESIELKNKETCSEGSSSIDKSFSNHTMGSRSPVFPCNVNTIIKSSTKHNSDTTKSIFQKLEGTGTNNNKFGDVVTQCTKEQALNDLSMINKIINNESSGSHHVDSVCKSTKSQHENISSPSITCFDKSQKLLNIDVSKIQKPNNTSTNNAVIDANRGINVIEQTAENITEIESLNSTKDNDNLVNPTENNIIVVGTNQVFNYVPPHKRVKKCIKPQSRYKCQPDSPWNNVDAPKSNVPTNIDYLNSSRGILNSIPVLQAILPSAAINYRQNNSAFNNNLNNYRHVLDYCSLVNTANHNMQWPFITQAPPPPPLPPPPTQPLPSHYTIKEKMAKKYPSINKQLTAAKNNSTGNNSIISQPGHSNSDNGSKQDYTLSNINYTNKQPMPFVQGSTNIINQATTQSKEGKGQISKITDSNHAVTGLQNVVPTNYSTLTVIATKPPNIPNNSTMNSNKFNRGNCQVLDKLRMQSEIDLNNISKDSHGFQPNLNMKHNYDYSMKYLHKNKDVNKNSPTGSPNSDPRHFIGMQVSSFIHRPVDKTISKTASESKLISSPKKGLKPLRPMSTKGYSPSILPIPPTYQKSFPMLSSGFYNNKTYIRHKNHGDSRHVNKTSDVGNKFNARNTKHSTPPKKISLEEYKKRPPISYGHSNYSKLIDKSGSKNEIKFYANNDKKVSKGSNFSDQDLGYDSDSTVIL